MQNTYVFCDVDGVLNSMPYFERIKGLKGFHEINDKNVEVLSLIIHKYNAKLVLASTWCELPYEEPIYQYLEQQLLKHDIRIYSKMHEAKYSRPCGIKTWLRLHANINDNFVILDDDCQKEEYAEYGLEEHFIQTKFWCENEEDGGLQKKHLPEINVILNKR